MLKIKKGVKFSLKNGSNWKIHNGLCKKQFCFLPGLTYMSDGVNKKQDAPPRFVFTFLHKKTLQ